MVGATTVSDLRSVACRGARELFDADWVTLVDVETSEVVEVSGGVDLPSREWLAAFVIGSRSGEGSFAAVDELARVGVSGTPYELLVSRSEVPLRQTELDIFVALADIFGRRLAQLGA